MTTRETERSLNDKRREQAVQIIVDNEKRKRARQTDELLLDQEALRLASISAGLETLKPD